MVLGQICLNDSYLAAYRDSMSAAGLVSRSNDKLRDVDEHYFATGHVFLFNQELLCSFDVCGSCEAHAILAQMQSPHALTSMVSKSSERTRKRYRKLVAKCQSKQQTVNDHGAEDEGDLLTFCGINQLFTLRDLLQSRSPLLTGNVNFAKCPSKFWQIY